MDLVFILLIAVTVLAILVVLRDIIRVPGIGTQVVPQIQSAVDKEQPPASRAETLKSDIAKGVSWGQKGEWEYAIGFYNDALNNDPKHVPALIQRGHAWTQLEKWEKALEDLDLAIQLDPLSPHAYICRGNVWALAKTPSESLFFNGVSPGPLEPSLQKIRRCIDDFTRAIELLLPDDPALAHCLQQREAARVEENKLNNFIKDRMLHESFAPASSASKSMELP